MTVSTVGLQFWAAAAVAVAPAKVSVLEVSGSVVPVKPVICRASSAIEGSSLLRAWTGAPAACTVDNPLLFDIVAHRSVKNFAGHDRNLP